uniref:CS domain-containing protein n=1 Tax=Rhabditophanes sp. KR3021 TaxID=114890 RepID=A0AC35THB2_9BILA
MTLLPQLLWAQRQNIVYLTVAVEDFVVSKLTVENDKVSVAVKKGASGAEYAVELELFGAVKAEYKQSASTRALELILQKDEEAWWPRLLKSTGKQNHIKVDFNKWKDEDETEDEPEAGGMYDGGMPGMGGAGGMPGMDGLNMEELMKQYGMGGAGGEALGGDMDDDDYEGDDDMPDLEDASEEAPKEDDKRMMPQMMAPQMGFPFMPPEGYGYPPNNQNGVNYAGNRSPGRMPPKMMAGQPQYFSPQMQNMMQQGRMPNYPQLPQPPQIMPQDTILTQKTENGELLYGIQTKNGLVFLKKIPPIENGSYVIDEYHSRYNNNGEKASTSADSETHGSGDRSLNEDYAHSETDSVIVPSDPRQAVETPNLQQQQIQQQPAFVESYKEEEIGNAAESVGSLTKMMDQSNLQGMDWADMMDEVENNEISASSDQAAELPKLSDEPKVYKYAISIYGEAKLNCRVSKLNKNILCTFLTKKGIKYASVDVTVFDNGFERYMVYFEDKAKMIKALQLNEEIVEETILHVQMKTNQNSEQNASPPLVFENSSMTKSASYADKPKEAIKSQDVRQANGIMRREPYSSNQINRRPRNGPSSEQQPENNYSVPPPQFGDRNNTYTHGNVKILPPRLHTTRNPNISYVPSNAPPTTQKPPPVGPGRYNVPPPNFNNQKSYYEDHSGTFDPKEGGYRSGGPHYRGNTSRAPSVTESVSERDKIAFPTVADTDLDDWCERRKKKITEPVVEDVKVTGEPKTVAVEAIIEVKVSVEEPKPNSYKARKLAHQKRYPDKPLKAAVSSGIQNGPRNVTPRSNNGENKSMVPQNSTTDSKPSSGCFNQEKVFKNNTLPRRTERSTDLKKREALNNTRTFTNSNSKPFKNAPNKGCDSKKRDGKRNNSMSSVQSTSLDIPPKESDNSKVISGEPALSSTSPESGVLNSCIGDKKVSTDNDDMGSVLSVSSMKSFKSTSSRPPKIQTKFAFSGPTTPQMISPADSNVDGYFSANETVEEFEEIITLSQSTNKHYEVEGNFHESIVHEIDELSYESIDEKFEDTSSNQICAEQIIEENRQNESDGCCQVSGEADDKPSPTKKSKSAKKREKKTASKVNNFNFGSNKYAALADH